MTWWILINYLFMLANLCLPYIIFMLRNPDDKKFKKKKDRQFILLLVMFAYLTYTILFESFWLCYLHSKMGLKWSKCFYGVKLLSGALHRLMGVIQATVAAIMLDSHFICIILTVLLLCSQLKAIYLVSKSLPLQKNNMLQLIERNCRITRATHYEAIN